ncbi:MAG: protein arginine kinase [Planctomycetota bacterium]
MRFNLNNAGEWLSGQGQDTDIVISTRMRLARNIEGIPFKGKISKAEEQQVESFLSSKVVHPGIDEQMTYVNLHDLDEVERLLLLENHLISLDHFNGKGARGVAFNPSGSISIMVNEEDHLRIQVIRSGRGLESSRETIEAIDDKLAEQVTWAFDENYGYLTSCPTNVGTGLRVSVMLHLPALVLSKHVEKVFNAIAQMNHAVRGFFGEGSQAVGDFFQISNQITLGKSPEDIIRSLTKVLVKIIEYERDVRKALLADSKKVLEDKVWRALGMLRSARSITSEETMGYLSSVRLGVTLNLLEDIRVQTINQLLLDVQPGHLQRIEGKMLEPDMRDIARANLIRSRLQENGHS